MDNEYDVIIIGGGPGGLTAAIYSGRAGRRTLVVEKAVPGGQVAVTDHLENYPGFPDGISGMELGQLMLQQAEKYGVEVAFDEVTALELDGKDKVVKTLGEESYKAKVVIIAGGASAKRLEVPGEVELTGRGVSYCAVCDGAFFRDQKIAVVGGGDSAIDEGLFLTRFASKVYIIHRRNELRAAKVLQERAFAEPKIEFVWDSIVERVVGDDGIKSLELRNLKTGQLSNLEVSGVFVYVGLQPNTDYLRSLVKLDEGGLVLVNDMMETDVAGVYAVGDIRHNSVRQAITAAGDGATAAITADEYLSNMK